MKKLVLVLALAMGSLIATDALAYTASNYNETSISHEKPENGKKKKKKAKKSCCQKGNDASAKKGCSKDKSSCCKKKTSETSENGETTPAATGK